MKTKYFLMIVLVIFQSCGKHETNNSRNISGISSKCDGQKEKAHVNLAGCLRAAAENGTFNKDENFCWEKFNSENFCN